MRSHPQFFIIKMKCINIHMYNKIESIPVKKKLLLYREIATVGNPYKFILVILYHYVCYVTVR